MAAMKALGMGGPQSAAGVLPPRAEGDAVPLLMEEVADEIEQAKAWRALDTIRIGVDLPAAASQLLRLLSRVEGRGDLYSGDAVAGAIHRYEHCWLALARELTSEEIRCLQPPLDVEWVWLCHRLNPEAYAEDCQEVCGRIVDGPLFAESAEDATGTMPLERDAAAACCKIWNRRFPETTYHGEDWERDQPGEREEGRANGGAASPVGRPGGAGGGEGARAAAAASQGKGEADAKGEAGEQGDGAAGRGDSCHAQDQDQDELHRPQQGHTELISGRHQGGPQQEGGAVGGAAPEAVPEPEPAREAELGAKQRGTTQQSPGKSATAGGGAAAAEVKAGEGPKSRLKYNLSAAVQRQASFFFQVDRLCMRDSDYVKLSLLRYRMFLHLVRLNQGLFCVPTYDVDLLWHAHMMCAVAYREDTIDLIGQVLGHDDTDAPPLPTGDVRHRLQSKKKLDWSFRATAKAWERTYGMPYHRAGAMHRGFKPAPLVGVCPAATAAAAGVAAAERLREAHGLGKLEKVVQVPRPLVLGRVPATQCLPLDRINSGKGLEPRIIFEAQVMLWGALNLQPSPSESFFVTMGAMAADPEFSIRSRMLAFKPGWPEPAWKQRWGLQCELHSKGLEFELRAESDGFWSTLWGPRSLGTGRIEWQEVLREPSLFLDKRVHLQTLLGAITGAGAGAGGKEAASGATKPPSLHVSVSVTPPEPGPYLLRMVFMRGTDDDGAMVCQDMYIERNCRPQMGRWCSRTVLDHADKEVFVIRKRVAKGMWMGRYRPQTVHYRESVIVVHQGGWKYLEVDPLTPADAEPPHLRSGQAKGPIIAQAVPMTSHDDLSVERVYCLLGCLEEEETATLTVRRTPGVLIFSKGIHLSLTTDSKAQVVLKPGRHLQYEVEGAAQSEELGFVTLIRFTPDAPQGRATALLSWKGAALQVSPGESVLLVLLLCVCIAEAINDMVGVNRARRFRRVALPDYDPAFHWEAVCDRYRPPPPSIGAAAAGVPNENQHEYSFASVERSFVHWWNRRPSVWHVGAASCGAGACGPSIYN